MHQSAILSRTEQAEQDNVQENSQTGHQVDTPYEAFPLHVLKVLLHRVSRRRYRPGLEKKRDWMRVHPEV